LLYLAARRRGASCYLFTCFTSTKVQILTHAVARLGGSAARLLLSLYTPLTYSPLTRLSRASYLHASYTPLTRLLHASYPLDLAARRRGSTCSYLHASYTPFTHTYTSLTRLLHASYTPLTRLLHASYTPDLAARRRGATCYLPNGTLPMLPPRVQQSMGNIYVYICNICIHSSIYIYIYICISLYVYVYVYV
jgi:hypothetical protein